jgi:hypothetical protein
MRKKLTLVWACLLCMLGMSVGVQAQNRFRPEPTQLDAVVQTVDASREIWLQMFPAEELPDYGFRDLVEKTRAIPGNPIEVFNMYRDFDGKIQSQPAGEYLVPLLVDGQARVFLTVAFFENKWQVVAVGEKNLAREAAAYISQAAKTNNHLVWLRNLNHSADFIADASVATTEANTRFMPLSTAERASFRQPLAYNELALRISKMIVQFD